jgi:hypothetical protein
MSKPDKHGMIDMGQLPGDEASRHLVRECLAALRST